MQSKPPSKESPILPKKELRVAHTRDELARTAAQIFARLAQAATSQGRFFYAALSGGKTPQGFFERLAADYHDKLDWSLIHIFWADERPVPPHHEASNYLNAKVHLLDKVPLPSTNIHRMHTERLPEEAAQAYDDQLRKVIRAHNEQGLYPRFDLIVLGVGEDGHTASLFPGTKALAASESWAVANYVPKLKETRVTLTLPVINAAACVLVLVSEAEKSAVVAEALQETPASEPSLPIARVAPREGRLIWLVEREAAAKLDVSGF